VKSISILGCGWLGLPLAKHFVEKGYQVKGSTTTASKMSLLEKIGIMAFNFQLPAEDPPREFFQSECLIINIPPKVQREGVKYHFNGVKSILKFIPPHQKLIYISSTSVYPMVDYPITEEHELRKDSERAQALIQTEQLLLTRFKERLTVIRLGGLLGYERIPGRYYSGKKLIQHQQKVNYIHRDDAIGIIEAVQQQGKRGSILNAVAPIHPTKKETFLKNAQDFNFTPPDFGNNKQELTNRLVESSKIESILDYSFIYPDPLHFYYTN